MARVTKTDRIMRDMIHAKGEPNWAGLHYQATNFKTDYLLAMNWVHHAVDTDALRGELVAMAGRLGLDGERVGGFDTLQLNTLGKIAYAANRGAQLAPSSIERVRAGFAAPAAPTTVEDTAPLMEHQAATAAGRLNEDYVACYSRLDNVRARVERGRITLKDVPDEVRAIMDAHGTRPGVRRRLVAHYTQSVAEARADVALKGWVKPLAAILRCLDKNAKLPAPKAVSVEIKPARKAPKGANTRQPTKATKVAPKAPKVTPKVAPKTGTSFASQVRQMITEGRRDNRSQADIIQLAISTLGMKSSSARNCVLANWDRIG